MLEIGSFKCLKTEYYESNDSPTDKLLEQASIVVGPLTSTDTVYSVQTDSTGRISRNLNPN